jgi:hypothetical protein
VPHLHEEASQMVQQVCFRSGPQAVTEEGMLTATLSNPAEMLKKSSEPWYASSKPLDLQSWHTHPHIAKLSTAPGSLCVRYTDFE